MVNYAPAECEKVTPNDAQIPAKLDNFSLGKVSERLQILMDADGLRTLLMIFVQRL